MEPDDDRQEYYVSSDIILEILTRTTCLKTLDTCKCVSKNWKHLIYESSFMPLYYKRTDNLFGYFIQDIKQHKHISTFVSMDQSDEEEGSQQSSKIGRFPYDDRHDDVRILASCNQGLLCCLRQIMYRNYRYYVCKPATQQWQPLPNPKLRYRTFAVAIMVLGSSPLRYKIVRLSDLDTVGNHSRIRCEIFDSNLWTWRETQGLILPFDETITRSSYSAVCVGKSVYWLTNHYNVLAFHEEDDDKQYFDIFPLPQTVNDIMEYKNEHRLFEYQGGLGFTRLRAQDSIMELWLLRNRHHEWTKKTAVNISCLERTVNYPSPTGFCNEDIAFMKAGNEVVFYNIQDGSFSTVEINYDFSVAHEYFQFRSDLEPVNLRSCC